MLLFLTASFAWRAPAETRVVVGVTPLLKEGLSVVVSAKALDGSTEPIEWSIVLDPAAGEREIRFRSDRVLAVQGEAAGYWSAPVVVGAEQEARLVLYRTARVSGVARGIETGEIKARLERRPGGAEPPTSEPIRCQPEPAESFRCDVPAGDWGFSVRAPRRAPVYEFGKPLQPGGELALGALGLTQGASLAGWVSAEGLGYKPSGARVFLWQRGGDLARAASTPASELGFFQLTGAQPGRYQAVAIQPGYARAILPVEIRADTEAFLAEPLVLGQARELALTIEPAVGPDGKPWFVVLRETASPDPGSVVGEGVAKDGKFRWRELRSGHRYWASLKTSTGALWFIDQVGFLADAPVVGRTLQVGVERISGIVFLGEEPLQASITFGLKSNLRIEMSSGSDGRFDGVLPSLGSWSARVISNEKGIKRDMDVQVVRAASGVGEAEIRLDDFALRGILVEETGSLAEPPAFLHLFRRDPPILEQSRVEGGRFRVGGLSPGEYVVYAESQALKSDKVTAILEKGDEPRELRLVMKPKGKLLLRVVDPGGTPVPAVPIAVGPARNKMPAGRNFIFTDASGRAEWGSVSAGEMDQCLALYGGERFASKLVSARVGEGEVTIELDTVGGTIVTKSASANGGEVELYRDGCTIWRGYFRNWKLQDFPRFSPGLYTLCPARSWPPGPQCASGVLKPLETLRLQLPGARPK